LYAFDTEKAVDPPGEAREDWRIIMELANRMGAKWSYTSAEDIWNEVRRTLPIFAGASYKRLKNSYGIFWPVYSETHPETPRLYTEGFAFHDRRASFIPIEPPKTVQV